MKLKSIYFAAAMLIPSLAAAEITVEEAWVRMPPPVADTAAGYMTLSNHADQDVEIVSISCDAADDPEFHSMEMHGGMMHMMEMEKVVVPAHGELRFESGGNHLMLKQLNRELHAGDHVMCTMKSSDDQSIMVHAMVRDLRDDAQHGDHHGGHHGH